MDQKRSCVQWLKDFIATIKPSKDKKVLIEVDGNPAHIKHLEAVE